MKKNVKVPTAVHSVKLEADLYYFWCNAGTSEIQNFFAFRKRIKDFGVFTKVNRIDDNQISIELLEDRKKPLDIISDLEKAKEYIENLIDLTVTIRIPEGVKGLDVINEVKKRMQIEPLSWVIYPAFVLKDHYKTSLDIHERYKNLAGHDLACLFVSQKVLQQDQSEIRELKENLKKELESICQLFKPDIKNKAGNKITLKIEQLRHSIDASIGKEFFELLVSQNFDYESVLDHFRHGKSIKKYMLLIERGEITLKGDPFVLDEFNDWIIKMLKAMKFEKLRFKCDDWTLSKSVFMSVEIEMLGRKNLKMKSKLGAYFKRKEVIKDFLLEKNFTISFAEFDEEAQELIFQTAINTKLIPNETCLNIIEKVSRKILMCIQGFHEGNLAKIDEKQIACKFRDYFPEEYLGGGQFILSQETSAQYYRLFSQKNINESKICLNEIQTYLLKKNNKFLEKIVNEKDNLFISPIVRQTITIWDRDPAKDSSETLLNVEKNITKEIKLLKKSAPKYKHSFSNENQKLYWYHKESEFLATLKRFDGFADPVMAKFRLPRNDSTVSLCKFDLLYEGCADYLILPVRRNEAGKEDSKFWKVCALDGPKLEKICKRFCQVFKPGQVSMINAFNLAGRFQKVLLLAYPDAGEKYNHEVNAAFQEIKKDQKLPRFSKIRILFAAEFLDHKEGEQDQIWPVVLAFNQEVQGGLQVDELKICFPNYKETFKYVDFVLQYRDENMFFTKARPQFEDLRNLLRNCELKKPNQKKHLFGALQFYFPDRNALMMFKENLKLETGFGKNPAWK